MKVHAIKNIQFVDDVFVCPESEGVVISQFHLEFESPICFLEKDHCECIDSFISDEDKTLKLKLVTDKNEIDEFLIFKLTKKNKPFNLKIRFKR